MFTTAGWLALIIIAITIGLLCGAICYVLFKKTEYPDLERKAELLSISHDTKEIKDFINAKMNYLTVKSFKMLLSRIEELEADKTLFNELYNKEDRNEN
jgi:hypothetical protein